MQLNIPLIFLPPEKSLMLKGSIHHGILSGPEDFQFIEFFAGSRTATTCVADAGFGSTCIDIADHKRAGYACGEGTVFDINSTSGFVLLSSKLQE